MIRPLRYQVGAPRMAAKPRSWEDKRTAPPSTAAASPDAGSFVFHDASGHRWSRIKRVLFAAAAALAVIGGAVLLALTHVAPGRAPSFALTGPQHVPNWPVRSSAGPATPAQLEAPSPAGSQGGTLPQTKAPASGAATPAPSVTSPPTAAPTPTARPTPRPRRTKPPLALRA